jgi:hypothetical protein
VIARTPLPDPGICRRCGKTRGRAPSHRFGVCDDGHWIGRYPRRHRGRHRACTPTDVPARARGATVTDDLAELYEQFMAE